MSSIAVTTSGVFPAAIRGFWRDSLDYRVAGSILLLVRLALGPMWIGTGLYWIRADNAPAEIANQIGKVMESGRTVGWYEPFLESVVLPNVALFAILVTWGEFLTGVSLTLGAATRLGAVVGGFLAANYALLYGNPFFPAEGNWKYLWYQAVLLLAAGGRSFGVDTYMARRWPRCPLW